MPGILPEEISLREEISATRPNSFVLLGPRLVFVKLWSIDISESESQRTCVENLKFEIN